MRSLARRCGPFTRPLSGLLCAAAFLALGAGLSRPAAAQDTITVSPAALTAILNGAEGQSRPRVSPTTNTTTKYALGFFQPISWAEFPFSVTNPGAYSLSLEYATPNDGATVVVDIRKAGTDQHIATPDITLAATASYDAYANLTAPGFSAPLAAGDYVLRIQNVGGTRYTASEGHGVNAGLGANFGSFTLNRTGSLPAMGTVSGVVNSSLGFPVANALVMAVAPANEVPEPGPFWYHGTWTHTDSQGKYTLSAPTGSYTIQAGRPDSYEIAGAKATASVTAGGATAPALQLTARRDFNGDYTVESEYYFQKNPDSLTDDATGIGLSGIDVASNGYKLGYIDPGNWVDVNVDVADSGWYTLTSLYFNGCNDPGIMRFTTDKGSSTQDAQPPTSWVSPGAVAFAKPIYLNKGHNVIRQYSVTGCSDMDAFKLSPGANPPGDVLRLEAEAYTNSGGGSAASPTGGSSGLVIDAADTTTAGKDGQTISGAQVGFWSSFGQSSFDEPSVGGTFDAPEYMEYVLDVGQDGMYDATVRGAFVGLDQPDVLRIWNMSYGPIADESFQITNDNSGGYGAAAMNQFPLPVQVPLKAGPNRLRIYLFGGLNVDWFQFSRSGALDFAGLVTGTVTAGGQPVAWAQVASEASLVAPTSPVALGTRAITGADGVYNLLLPTGSQTIRAAALGLAAAPATVDVTAAPKTQDFALTNSGKYEGEWWTNAWQSATPSGHGLSAIDLADASEGQLVGYFDTNLGNTSEKEFVEYTVNAPSAGVYTLALHYLTDALTPDAGIPLLVQVPSTGANIAVTVPKSDTLTDFTVGVGIPMKAGANTLRLVNNSAGKGSLDLDYFTVTATTQGIATLKGTVSNQSDGSPVGGAQVVITSGETVVANGVTDGVGGYAFTLPLGAYNVAVSSPGYQPQTKTATLATAGQVVAVDFSMVRGRLRGTVKDMAGQPVANTAFIVTDPAGTAITAMTDANGQLDTPAGFGLNTVLADVPLTVTEPSSVDVGLDTQATFTVEPLTDGRPIPLTFDQDFFTTETEAGSADAATFHTVSGPFSLPAGEDPGFGAASYPTQVTLSGLPFLAGDPTGKALNVLSLIPDANTITMPGDLGHYKAAVLIVTTDSGRHRGTATINYTDGTSAPFLYYSPEWFGGRTNAKFGPDEEDLNGVMTPLVNAYEIFRFSHRHLYTDNTGDGDGSGKYEFRFFSTVLPLDATKTVASIVLPPDTNGTSGTNPFVWGLTMAGSVVPAEKLSARAMKIAGGLQPSPDSSGADFAALNVVTTGASASRIDVLDVVALLRQGK